MLKLATFWLLLLAILCNHSKGPVLTQVTFLYDIKRGDIEKFRRDFSYYLSFF